MKELPREEIEKIRQGKREGKSLRKIAREFHRSKSTVSYYCRDLYTHPQRVHQTEGDARQRIHRKKYACISCGKPVKREGSQCIECYKKHRLAKKPRKRYETRYPCTGCGKPIRKKGGQCIDCYNDSRVRVKMTRRYVPTHRKMFTSAQEPKKRPHRYPTAKVEICPDSPIQRHWWIISSLNIGVCKWCHKVRDFKAIQEEEKWKRLKWGVPKGKKARV